MKCFPLLLAVLLLPLLACAEDLKRADGTIFKGTIVRNEPDGLVVQTDAGIEKVDFVMLSTELQKRFNYDSAKAEAYRQQGRASRAAAQQQLVQQQLAAVRAQSAAIDDKQNQQPSPEEAAKRLRIEQTVVFVTAAIQQGTTKGVRASLTVQTGRPAATMLGKDTRATIGLGDAFIYGLEGAGGETWQGKLYPAGYYHYTTSLGEEDTMKAFATTVDEALAHGADGRGPAIPSVNPAAVPGLPGNLRGGTLLDR
ncbi:MAG: hypothetical protein ABJF10_15640 [Chthoniobacter sp.]|uniref:hypothetical protein n=1 Tax=Chthoniobacter sp. TaxID=2510640 RepID=UPI0032AB3B26